MINKLIPQNIIDHLNAGHKIIFIATPFDSSKEALTCAFDLHHIYDAKQLPTGVSWVRDAPSGDLPEGKTAEQIIESFLSVTMRMAESVGGASIDFIIGSPSAVINN